jgi:hypothetical protein
MAKKKKTIEEAFVQAAPKEKKITLEPGLLFRAPEDNDAHDYQPSWDYMVQTHPDEELAALASEAAKRIYQRTKQPFECWACELPAGAVAMYINGTCGYPVVLLDLEMHRDHTDQFYKSIDHELKHAVQEMEGRDFDEDEAEDDLSEIPDDCKSCERIGNHRGGALSHAGAFYNLQVWEAPD